MMIHSCNTPLFLPSAYRNERGFHCRLDCHSCPLLPPPLLGLSRRPDHPPAQYHQFCLQRESQPLTRAWVLAWLERHTQRLGPSNSSCRRVENGRFLDSFQPLLRPMGHCSSLTYLLPDLWTHQGFTKELSTRILVCDGSCRDQAFGKAKSRTTRTISLGLQRSKPYRPSAFYSYVSLIRNLLNVISS